MTLVFLWTMAAADLNFISYIYLFWKSSEGWFWLKSSKWVSKKCLRVYHRHESHAGLFHFFRDACSTCITGLQAVQGFSDISKLVVAAGKVFIHNPHLQLLRCGGLWALPIFEPNSSLDFGTPAASDGLLMKLSGHQTLDVVTRLKWQSCVWEGWTVKVWGCPVPAWITGS